MTTRAVTYARVSSDDHNKGGLNLSGQLDICRSFAVNKGYTIIAELAEDDHGVSGTLLESPALVQALDMASQRQFDVLIVREIDRFARSLAKQLIVEQKFKKFGIKLEFVLESYDNTPEGSLHKNIKAVIAEFERVKINERTKRGRLQKVKAGNVLVHGRPPYGYRLQERDGKSQLIVHEPEAYIVRMIYDWYVNGDDDHVPFSSRAIAQRLHEINVAVPSASEQTRNVWSHTTIQHILTNETYAGSWYYGKFANQDGRRVAHPEHKWLLVATPAIVTREVWKIARKKRIENINHSPRRIRNSYLLHHHVTCAKCGSKMAARSSGNIQARRLYYYCPTARESAGKAAQCSNTAFFRADHTDATIWNCLRDYLANRSLVKSGLDQFIEQNEEAISPIRERMEIVKNLLDHDNEQLEKIADLYIGGAFSRDRLTERKKKLESKMSGLANEFAQLTERLQNWSYFPEQTEMLKKFVSEISERLDEADGDFEHRQKIIEFLDVNAALSFDNGKPTAKLIFAFDEIVMTIEKHTKGVRK